MAYPKFEDSAGAFIQDTDASNVSIGAVLSQIQDGTERPIAYGSRVLTKAVRNYDASNREALALVYFAEYFRHYLLARPFVARTDNTALTALRNLKEPRGRKARWIDGLSEYEFRVVHRPGRQHLNADGLSRLLAEPEAHVHSESPPLAPTPSQDAAPATSSAVTVELDDLSSAAIADAQRSNPELSTVWSWYDAASGKFVRPPENGISGVSRTVKIIWSQIDQLSLRDSVLYVLPPFADHDHVGESPRLVVPCSLQERAMIAVHSLPTANHPGVEKTLSQARLCFYWVGMASDITEFVRCCHTCAQIRAKNPTNHAPLQPMIAGYPFEIVALDIVSVLCLKRHRAISISWSWWIILRDGSRHSLCAISLLFRSLQLSLMVGSVGSVHLNSFIQIKGTNSNLGYLRISAVSLVSGRREPRRIILLAMVWWSASTALF